MKSSLNFVGVIIVLLGSLILIIPALLQMHSNILNVSGCLVILVGVALHIILNRRNSTVSD